MATRKINGAPADAAGLLRVYHRQVEEWIVELAQARARERRRELARAVAPLGAMPPPGNSGRDSH